MPPEPIQVIYDHGVYLPEADLWLDPGRVKARAFVSHAHADHFGRHHSIITGETNARILEARFGGKKKAESAGPKSERSVVAHPWHLPFPIAENFRATLLPAGHVLGSAQIHIERISDGATLLYTGDFKLRPGLAAEPPEWKRADSLIMETTFGRQKYTLPPAGEILNRLRDFVLETLGQGKSPVLLGYSLGKAQEILAALGRAEIDAPIVLHKSVFAMTEVYRELGMKFPPYSLLDRKTLSASQILIFPPNAGRSMLPGTARFAMFSGWAIDAGAKYRYRVDEAFPLSDHADYPDLLQFVNLVQPRLVHTLHGFASDFARDLRARGYEAWSLVSDDQLELELGIW